MGGVGLRTELFFAEEHGQHGGCGDQQKHYHTRCPLDSLPMGNHDTPDQATTDQREERADNEVSDGAREMGGGRERRMGEDRVSVMARQAGPCMFQLSK